MPIDSQRDQPRTISYEMLGEHEKMIMRAITDGMVDALNDYASMMERGEIEMRSGPVALREFAANVNAALLQKEGK